MTTSAERFGDDFGAERMWGLKELALPADPGWLPLAPGWYVAGAALLLLAGVLAWRAWQRWQRDADRRRALAEVRAMRAAPAAAAALPELLRATAVRSFDRAEVASLRGTAWIAWLNGTARRTVFREEDAGLMDGLVYRQCPAPADTDVQRLIDAAETWLRHARV